MTKFAHPLDPTLTPLFEGGRIDAPQVCDNRTLFYNLLHVSEQPAVLEVAYRFIKQQLKPVQSTLSSDGSKSYHPDTFPNAFNAVVPDLTQPPRSDHYQALSPVVCTELAWLDNILQASTNQTPLALDLQALSLTLNQGVQANAFVQSQLLTTGMPLPEIHTWAFAQQPDIPAVLFDFAALQLALREFPRVFFPEILGFTFGYCQTAGLLGLLEPVFLQTRKPLLQAQLPVLLQIMREYIAYFPVAQEALWHRIQSGYGLYYQQTDRCLNQLQALEQSVRSTQQAVLALLERLRSRAIGHHANITLSDKSIDAWFAQSPFDGEGFLQALRQSAYIDQQHPANSRLFKLFEFNGPMFGVLNAHEQALLKSWGCAEDNIIDNKDRREGRLFYLPFTYTDRVRTRNQSSFVQSGQKSVAQLTRLNDRDWYYTLVNIDLFPSTLNAAKQRVHRLLKLIQLFNRSPFRHYSHQAFSDYIDAIYQREINAYQPLADSPRIAKSTYIWAIEQLAPTILTDGCWLQNIQQLKHRPTHTVGALLSKIYSDELGGGILVQNHPYIYQQLLNSIGLHLPPIHSRAFSQHPGFINSAFDIPNYLLAISRFPIAFLPELLGLNMAIELSGLGKDYLRLAQALKFYELDPRIVQVHISIDNIATGHAALAKQAIALYLDEILACSGEQVMQQHWQRIYTGYCSLAWVSRRFTFALVKSVLLKCLSNVLATCFKASLRIAFQ
jgi:hypothetical protein